MNYRDFVCACGEDLFVDFAPYWPYDELCVDVEQCYIYILLELAMNHDYV